MASSFMPRALWKARRLGDLGHFLQRFRMNFRKGSLRPVFSGLGVLSHFDPIFFFVSRCEQNRTAVVSKTGPFVVSKAGRAIKSGLLSWPSCPELEG
jgi:hypothetical protein